MWVAHVHTHMHIYVYTLPFTTGYQISSAVIGNVQCLLIAIVYMHTMASYEETNQALPLSCMYVRSKPLVCVLYSHVHCKFNVYPGMCSMPGPMHR